MSANNVARILSECPSCAQPMRLIQRTRRFSELLENLCTFECRACGVSLFAEYGATVGTISKTENLHKFGNPTREIKVRCFVHA